MKNHHTYPRAYIGESDIAALIMVGMRPKSEKADGADWLKTQPLHFGEDGAYNAYIVDEDCEIAPYYSMVATFEHWISIYDDSELTLHAYASEIRVFCAGSRGVIIQLIGRKTYDSEKISLL